ncbi:hypothetical protein OS493_011657 [Desmophyllum pertusum]|uniref:Uncharacterized protein n=1 Tax=Desmophyllum pertusum TaxID=174260 RepID=A0A9X0CNI7_9CNID|nr:hypothetical protein OS493_011657 [Desmophyllum pertusum]
MHLTHSICSRASVKRLSPLPQDSDDRPSSKQSSPPRLRKSLSHSLLAFSSRGRIPLKFFSDGVFSNFTHNSGSASAISPLITDETSLPELGAEIFRHFDILDAAFTDVFSFYAENVDFRCAGAEYATEFEMKARQTLPFLQEMWLRNEHELGS